MHHMANTSDAVEANKANRQLVKSQKFIRTGLITKTKTCEWSLKLRLTIEKSSQMFSVNISTEHIFVVSNSEINAS